MSSLTLPLIRSILKTVSNFLGFILSELQFSVSIIAKEHNKFSSVKSCKCIELIRILDLAKWYPFPVLTN